MQQNSSSNNKFLFTCTIIISIFLVLNYTFKPIKYSSDEINLAIRRTIHLLLLESNDSISTIPPVEQLDAITWKVPLNNAIHYDNLPAVLQSSFDLYHIQIKYNVELIKCSDNLIAVGYSYYDVQQNQSPPCAGRNLVPDCYQFKLILLPESNYFLKYSTMFLLLSLLLSFIIIYRWPGFLKRKSIESRSENFQTDVILFGNSSLNVMSQRFTCQYFEHQLTYRETKLLQFLAQNRNQVLERNTILERVWSDEGIIVSRSLDMFVSRLRKILKNDPSIQISSIHGIGYKLEIKN